MSKIQSKNPNWDSLSRTIYRESRKNASVFFSRVFRILTFRFHRTNTVIKLFDKAVDEAQSNGNKQKLSLLEWKFIDLFADAKLNKKQQAKISVIQHKLFDHYQIINPDQNQNKNLNPNTGSKNGSSELSDSSNSDTNLDDLSSDSDSYGSESELDELNLEEPPQPQIQGRQEEVPKKQEKRPELMAHSSFFNQLEQKFLIVDVPGDGDCFFYSVAFQVYPEMAERGQLREAVLLVRKDICDYMAENRELFEYLIERDFDKHLKTMRKSARKTGSKGWGGQAELIAATKKYGRPVQMFTSSRFEQDLSQGIKPFQVFGEEQQGKPLYMLYNGRNHWETLISLEEMA